MQVLALGKELLFLASWLTVAIVALALIGALVRDRRFVVSARVGFYVLFALVLASSACLVHGFLTGQYDNEYIRRYSERVLRTPFKVAGLWAGLDGSMLFWTLILCGFSAVCALQHRSSSRHPVGRRMEPWVYVVLAAVIGFFILVCYHVTNPFREVPLADRLRISPDGIVPDGAGLNPQLENYWMAIHPPILYLGLVGFTIPFAYSLAALIAGEMGDYWIKVTRRWTLVTWSFLTFGVILGGLWAYEMLGWGGYWAWDPVENASILPWFVGTAFLHSVMVQERRDMLRGWNVFLIVLTFFMTIVATYMTRSGVVNSVHAFSEGKVGAYFLPFMMAIVFASALMMGLRARLLRGKHSLESLLSREAAFFFNNLILLALMATVYLLSMSAKISHDFFLDPRSARETVYNLVTTPLFLLLLLLTGLGPQLGWVKTSSKVLLRRTLWPTVISAVVCLALLPLWIQKDDLPNPFDPAQAVAQVDGSRPGAAASGMGPGMGLDPDIKPLDLLGGSPVAKAIVDKTHYYSLLLGIGFSVFIIATVAAELWRGVGARRRHRGAGLLGATLDVVLGNNRRWGGYIVHIGIALTAIGVIWSATFRIHEDLTVSQGVVTPVGDSGYSVVWAESKELPRGQTYSGEALRFDILKDGDRVASLWPELRNYPKNQPSEISIPAIGRNFYNDYYIHYSFRDAALRTRSFSIFVNPLVNWIWAGAAIMLFGGLFAALPAARRRIGLAS